MKDGRIVSEIYRNNSVASTRFIGWSMTKSVTSVLIGCALAEKRIDSLDTPVSRSLPELKGGGYDGVTILQVMQMRSGVDYPERYDFANPGIAASNHIASLVKTSPGSSTPTGRSHGRMNRAVSSKIRRSTLPYSACWSNAYPA